MKKILISIFVLLVGFSFIGCSTGKNIQVGQIDKIRKGVTTEKQIYNMFGEPTKVSLNYKRKRRVLTYQYGNSDSFKKGFAGALGAGVGSALGRVGSAVGGLVGMNSVRSRSESKTLTVVINTRTKKVVDFNYIQGGGRDSQIGIGGSIDSL